MGLDEAASISLRAFNLDRMTMDFLSRHPEATVIHLACGLDARCERLKWGGGVRWYDVDLGDVVALRSRLFPDLDVEGREYTLMEGSATDLDSWIGQIPVDRPTVVVFEGLSMYLREEEGRRLIEELVSKFRGVGGELVFDCFGSAAIWLQGYIKAVKNTGSVLYWGFDDPKVLEGWCDGLELVEDQLFWDMAGVEKCPALMRAKMWVVSWVPYLRTSGRLLRYRF